MGVGRAIGRRGRFRARRRVYRHYGQSLYAPFRRGGRVLVFGLYALLGPVLGNHALWLSFIIYLGLRSLTLGIIFRHKLHNAL